MCECGIGADSVYDTDGARLRTLHSLYILYNCIV